MGTLSTWGKNAALGGLPNTVYAQAHSGDPGVNGTANVLAGVARIPVPLAAAANGQRLPAAGTYQFDILAGQTISHVSYWSAPAGGDFVSSDPLDVPEGPYGANGRYTLMVQTFAIND